MTSQVCRPVSADVVLRRLTSGEELNDVCALCACSVSLIKMDDTNYVHLNDEYNDRRLTIKRLVEEMNFDCYIDDQRSPLICESCVHSLCNFQLFKNKCKRVKEGLKNLRKLIEGDQLEKVVNVSTKMPATILPHKLIHEYSADVHEEDFSKYILKVETCNEFQSDTEDLMLTITKLQSDYTCELCPKVKIKKKCAEQHALMHYYKMMTKRILMKESYCVCCLGDQGLVTEMVTSAEKLGDMTLGDIFHEVFGYADVNDLGEVELCKNCFKSIISLYNFKKMFQASTTVIRDCVVTLQYCLEWARKATITEDQHNNGNVEKRSVWLLSAYDTFLQLSEDRIKSIKPFLKSLKAVEYKEILQIKPEPFYKNKRLQLQICHTKKISKDKYVCTVCGTMSETLDAAKMHRMNHCRLEKQQIKQEPGNYACHVCGDEFQSLENVRNHIDKDHSDIVFCLFCDKMYKEPRKPLLTSHMELCKNIDKPFECDLCKLSFTKKAKLEQHRVRHFPKTHTCQYCSKKYWTVRELSNHLTKIHREKLGRQFECSMCHQVFSGRTEYVNHLATHDPDTRHVCKFCNSSFRKKTNYIAHACVGKILNLRESKKRLEHMKNFLEPDVQFTPVVEQDSNETECICDHCGKRFNTERYLKAHLQVHKKNKGVDIKKKVSGKFSCDRCEYTTSYSKCLEAHINRFHKKIKPYQCPVCRRTFYSRLNQSQHMKTHITRERHSCDICNKQFLSKKALILHTRLHTGEKPYPCDLCGEKFVTANRRQDHRMRKHFPPSVECSECGKRFFTTRECTWHFNGVHSEEQSAEIETLQLGIV